MFLEGSFDSSHAQTRAILLPHTARFNASAAQELLAPATRLFGANFGGGLWDFATAAGAPLALPDFGFPEKDLERAADLATRNRYANPRDFSAADIMAILRMAVHGEKPHAIRAPKLKAR